MICDVRKKRLFCYQRDMPATPAWPPASTPRLFLDVPLADQGEQTIAGPAAHYLINVMRTKIGDPLLLFDNRSGEWLARVTATGKRALSVTIDRRTRPFDPVPDLWLCFAPLKKARMDWVIEKATELGIAKLQPVITERTIVDRVNADRLIAQMVEACEQCGRTSIPSLAAPVKLPQLLANWPDGRTLLFADEQGGAPLTRIAAPAPAALLIGPEGGFTDGERRLLLTAQATRRLSLGPRILRAETAAVAGISLWMATAGDWAAGPASEAPVEG